MVKDSVLLLQRAQVRSLVRESRSHMPCPAAKRERKKKKDQGGRQKPEREGQRLRKRGNRDLEEERTARHSREMIVK